MKHELGISVYPDLKPLEEIEAYFELAGRYGVSRVFSSMFSVKGTKEEVLDYFRKLIVAAHKSSLKVSLDVNPMCFEKMGAAPDDLSVFKSIDVDILRMDLSFGPENDAKLVRNPHGITIEFNNTPEIVKGLMDCGIDTKDLLFDFFPHLEMGDSSEWIWRTRISRFKYSKPDEVLAPRPYEKEMFETGDVVVVNDNYKHYAGEIQIVKIPIVNDGTRNRVGHLDEEEYQMMELVYDGDLVEFLEK